MRWRSLFSRRTQTEEEEPLLDYPFLSKAETTSLLQDIEALKAGTLTGVVGSDLWHRALVEIAKLQHKREIEISRSLVHATWVLVIATWVLVAATLIVALVTRS